MKPRPTIMLSILHIFLLFLPFTNAFVLDILKRQDPSPTTRISPSNTSSSALSSLTPFQTASVNSTLNSTALQTTTSASIPSSAPTSPPSPSAVPSSGSSTARGLSGAALTGVVAAGVALVLLSGLFLWAVHFRKKKPAQKALRGASKAVKTAHGRMMQRSNHVRLDTKDYGASSGSLGSSGHESV